LSPAKPVVYILHGDDKVAIDQYIATLESHLGEPGIAEMNLSRLDGRVASDEDLRGAALALPFLADRRLVILTNPLSRMSVEGASDRFIKFLDSLPQSTALVLVIEDQHFYKGWKTLHEKHWLSIWAEKAGERAIVKDCSLPDANSMPGWIVRKAEKLGGKITHEGAAELAEHTGNDTALATQEITKLLTYVDGQRAVDADDVALLVETGGPVDIFPMLGALSNRNGKEASGLLHALLQRTSASEVFYMVVRQFRFLLQIREIIDEGGNLDLVKHEIPRLTYAGQYYLQAQRFTQAELDGIYHRLLQLDEGIKSSQVSDDLALELLVAEITH